MRIYFTTSKKDIPKEHLKRCEQLVKTLISMGHVVYAKHIFGEQAAILENDEKANEEKVLKIEQRMIAEKNKAELIVAEVSYHDIRVGQEIEYVISRNKPVVALHLKDRRPVLLRAIGEDYLHIAEYTPESLRNTIEEYIEYAKDYVDTRFNFFVSSEIDNFLDWISKEKKVPRAVFLRQLIEEDMKKNRQYLKEVGKNL